MKTFNMRENKRMNLNFLNYTQMAVTIISKFITWPPGLLPSRKDHAKDVIAFKIPRPRHSLHPRIPDPTATRMVITRLPKVRQIRQIRPEKSVEPVRSHKSVRSDKAL